MRVLFLTQTTELGPSSRYRVYQLLPWLRKLGIEADVSPAIDDDLYAALYGGGTGSTPSHPRRTAWKPSLQVAAFRAICRKRQSDLDRLDNFDAVFVQKGIFPGLYSGFERRIAARKPLVFDFDDAIWLPRQRGSPLLRFLHRESKVQDILRVAAAVIAGNEFLAAYARRFNGNVMVVPSTVDVARYSSAGVSPVRSDPCHERHGRDARATIGWIGSRTTLPYLLPLKPVFERLGIIPRVIASGDPATLGFSVEFRPWQLETEIQELQELGIGLAPLPDTPWERGKCGVKLLQYMACGIPVVASPVGVHCEIIRHGENGVLAETGKDWRECLHALSQQPALREKLGQAGRRTVEQHYDIPIAAQKVAMVLKTAAGQP